jgi:dienelactone hydrolase
MGVGWSVQAETTPLDQPLEEGGETLITCELTQAPKRTEVPVFSSTKQCEETKGTYHYKLWLPAGYSADPQRRWPCLFISSPGGKAGMGQMAAWIKAHDYIAVMLVEAKNGPWATIIGNFLAAHDDVVKRVRIQEGLKLATGMSGGARASSVYAQLRPGFAGLILQAAGAAYDDRNNYHVAKLKGSHSIFVAMTMGEKDGNKREVAQMKTAIGATRFSSYSFAGGHGWAPPETFEQAITWVEQQIYRKSGTPPAVKKLLAPRCAAPTQ